MHRYRTSQPTWLKQFSLLVWRGRETLSNPSQNLIWQFDTHSHAHLERNESACVKKTNQIYNHGAFYDVDAVPTVNEYEQMQFFNENVAVMTWAVDPDDWDACLEYASQSKLRIPALGIHPWYLFGKQSIEQGWTFVRCKILVLTILTTLIILTIRRATTPCCVTEACDSSELIFTWIYSFTSHMTLYPLIYKQQASQQRTTTFCAPEIQRPNLLEEDWVVGVEVEVANEIDSYWIMKVRTKTNKSK
jgi:hypothetical protein